MHDFDDFADEISNWQPANVGGREERRFVKEALEPFRDDCWFSDILYRVAGGKEANVYCCQGHEHAPLPLIAAKVYRPTIFRSMRNDWFYKQGRTAIDEQGKAAHRGRSLRAIRRNTRFAQKIHTQSWCQHEYATLQKLHEAGADVPQPLAAGEAAILTAYIGDADVAAPTLHGVSLDRREALELFERLMWNFELFLEQGIIHADLSAYNVLYWHGQVKVIDWPQAVDLLRHPQAYDLLLRDITRLCDYFALQGVSREPAELAHRMWQRHGGL